MKNIQIITKMICYSQLSNLLVVQVILSALLKLRTNHSITEMHIIIIITIIDCSNYVHYGVC